MKKIVATLALLCGAISALAQQGNEQKSYPNDPLVGSQWYLDSIGVKQTWTPSSGLASVFTSTIKVVVMDSGVSPVSELFQNLDAMNSRTFFDSTSPTDDTSTKGFLSQYPTGHGTLVSGIIGAVGNNNAGIAGINWHTDLVSYKVFGVVDTAISGTTTLTTSYDAILKAFVALQDLPGNLVVNASFAMPVSDESFLKLWREAIVALGDRVLVVAAAGNDGSATAQYPCAFGIANVICVGSTDQNGKISQFSDHGNWVDIVAPGEGILTTANDGTFQSVSGTSFSAPMVSGVASLLWQGQPNLKSSELKQAILFGANFNFALIGQVAGARQLSLQGSINALQNPATSASASPQMSISAFAPLWTDQSGLSWGGLTTAYGDNFTDGVEFSSATPQTRLGNIGMFIGTIPLPLSYVGSHQINFQFPMDNFQFSQGGNTIVIVKYDNNGSIVSFATQEGVRPVAYNPGFLTGPDGKIFTETANGETTIFAAGLGFTNPWVKAGNIGIGTEKVSVPVMVTVDNIPIFGITATASNRWPGIYEIHTPAISANSTTIFIQMGTWLKKFFLK